MFRLAKLRPRVIRGKVDHEVDLIRVDIIAQVGKNGGLWKRPSLQVQTANVLCRQLA